MRSRVLIFSLIMLLIPFQQSYSEQVSISDHRIIVDSAGVKHIKGIVENHSNTPIESIRVTAKVLDKYGKVIATYPVITVIKMLMPDYMTPFDIPISDSNVAMNMASYSLSLEYRKAEPKEEKLEFDNITAFIWSHIDPETKEYRNPHGDFCYQKCYFHHTHHVNAHSEVDGSVFNTGSKMTEDISIAIIWFDENGRFYSFDQQYLSKRLAPNQSSKFVVMTHPALGYYSIVAESSEYVGMLDNGEKIFRLYDANYDNPRHPGVNTVRMGSVNLIQNNMEIGKLDMKSVQVIPHYHPRGGDVYTLSENGVDHNIGIKTSDEIIFMNYFADTNTLKFITTHSKDNFHLTITIPTEFSAFSAKDFIATLYGIPLTHSFSFDINGDNILFHFMLSEEEIASILEEAQKKSDKEIPKDVMEFTLKPIKAEKIIVKPGMAVELRSTLTNTFVIKQKAMVIMEIEGENETRTSWIQYEILPQETIDIAFSWTPENGIYTIRIFVVDSPEYKGLVSGDVAEATIKSEGV